MVHEIAYETVVTPRLRRGAFERNDHPGFHEDYLALHCLLRAHGARRVMEIGTSSGMGTNVICAALGVLRWFGDPRRVCSIDVPPGTDPRALYPEGEDGHPAVAGARCRYPYTQLFGDSLTFDFTPYYPRDAWFIDGKHDYAHALGDGRQALRSAPNLVVWHDADMPEVARAVEALAEEHPSHTFCRVARTRLACAAAHPR